MFGLIVGILVIIIWVLAAILIILGAILWRKTAGKVLISIGGALGLVPFLLLWAMHAQHEEDRAMYHGEYYGQDSVAGEIRLKLIEDKFIFTADRCAKTINGTWDHSAGDAWNFIDFSAADGYLLPAYPSDDGENMSFQPMTIGECELRSLSLEKIKEP